MENGDGRTYRRTKRETIRHLKVRPRLQAWAPWPRSRKQATQAGRGGNHPLVSHPNPPPLEAGEGGLAERTYLQTGTRDLP